MTAPRVRVLSWRGRWGEALREFVSGPFERETGIGVEHCPHIGLELPGALNAALAAGSVPPADVVWCNALPALRAAAAGQCVPLDPDLVPALAGLHDRARPGGYDGYPLVHPYVVHYVLGYHQGAFPGGPPESWDVMLDPRHRGRIALYPGGHGLYPIAQVMGGGDLAGLPSAMGPCWSWLRRLSGNMAGAGGTGVNGHLAYSIGMADELRRDRLDLAMRALPNVLAFRAGGLPVDWAVPREGTSDTLDALWVPRGVPPDRVPLAQRFVGFALRPDVQERWCGHLGVLPVHRAAAAPALLRDHPRLPGRADDTDGILYLPETVKARCQPAWEAEFARLFGDP